MTAPENAEQQLRPYLDECTQYALLDPDTELTPQERTLRDALYKALDLLGIRP